MGMSEMQIHIHIALGSRVCPLGLAGMVALLVPAEMLVFFINAFHLYLFMYI